MNRFQPCASIFQDSQGGWEMKIKINIFGFNMEKSVSVGFYLTPKWVTLSIDVNILDCLGSYMDKKQNFLCYLPFILVFSNSLDISCFTVPALLKFKFGTLLCTVVS